MPVDFESILLRHNYECDHEKLAMLKRVFEKVCRETGIFPDAIAEREALVTHILKAAITEPIEAFLVEQGHHAIAQFRQNLRPKQ